MKITITLWVFCFGLLSTQAFAQDSTAAAVSDVADAPKEITDNEPLLETIEEGSVPPLIPVEAFSGKSQLSAAKLSPDGAQMAVEIEIEGAAFVVFFDADTRKIRNKMAIAKGLDLNWFRWVSNNKLIFSVSKLGDFFGDEVRYSRLYFIDTDKLMTHYIGRKEPVVDGDDVIFTAKDGSYLLLSLQRTPYVYPSIWRFDLTENGKMREIQRPKEGVWNWYADNDGTVRMGTGWLRNRLRVYYREDASSKLKLIAKLEEGSDERYWDVAQIVSGSDQGYVLEEGENNRVGIRMFDYAKREVVGTFYENADWDIDSMLLRDGEPLAAYYTDDRDQIEWFDQGLKKTHANLEKALGTEEVWISSRARDDSRMLVWAGGEADPGVLYIYTPGEKRLDQFAELRPNLDFRLLVKPKPISYTARDGSKISAYLILPKGRKPEDLPLIILPHGGPYGVRDKLQYDDEVQLLANRGYAVIQPNYRGSGGYGKAFSDLGTGEIGRGMQDDLDDAMDWAVAEGIVDPTRVCVVGGSYGGYAALWAVLRNPERYRCAASWAGVMDWDLMLKYDRQYFSRKGGKRWRARVEGAEDFDLDTVSPYRLADTLNRPVLLAHGTEDSNVPFSQFKKMRNATKKAPVPPELLIIKDEGHSFSKPENRKQWYDALEAFLAKHNPAD